jgi:hypothetical protein
MAQITGVPGEVERRATQVLSFGKDVPEYFADGDDFHQESVSRRKASNKDEKDRVIARDRVIGRSERQKLYHGLTRMNADWKNRTFVIVAVSCFAPKPPPISARRTIAATKPARLAGPAHRF